MTKKNLFEDVLYIIKENWTIDIYLSGAASNSIPSVIGSPAILCPITIIHPAIYRYNGSEECPQNESITEITKTYPTTKNAYPSKW